VELLRSSSMSCKLDGGKFESIVSEAYLARADSDCKTGNGAGLKAMLLSIVSDWLDCSRGDLKGLHGQ
jgi:hypothetical protein